MRKHTHQPGLMDNTRMTKKELLNGCRKGNLKYQSALYQQHYQELFGICLRYSSSLVEAKFLLKETFIRVFQYLYKYHPGSDMDKWMKDVAIYLALQHLMKKGPLFPAVEYSTIDKDYRIADTLPDAVKCQQLLEALQQLPDGYRAIFNLYAIEEQTFEQIAAELGITGRTAEFQFSKAKTLLLNKLGQSSNLMLMAT